ncbi:hypothetical protein [Hydrogenophaga sp. NFH-34]|uniref:hypothetical protein n=1 Tax=Hydrogenophaga sp. NFH-34 TaxID=2744446 RepID=UPI001F19836F|nr:hypothetical protein [Hydrogenophaga sp. NFH-34]
MFSDLALHDATLEQVVLSWASGQCTFRLVLVGGERHELTFFGVSNLHAPRQFPWGPSVSVNSVHSNGNGAYEVELQSGDVMAIEAESWKLQLSE